MKQLIIAGLLAATFTSAQAAPFDWMPFNKSRNGDIYDIAKGSFLAHAGVIAVVVRETTSDGTVTVANVMLKQSECNNIRANMRFQNLADNSKQDIVVVRGSGTIADSLVDVICRMSEKSKKTDSL